MAKLRAKKPVVALPRLKTLLYANTGVGKTHFCCSLPDVYYIDTETKGFEDYPHFAQMMVDNKSDVIYLTELTDILEEVKTLMTVKHHYKTLVIDSISFPAFWLAQMEAERLALKGRGDTEGTEFGANLAKAKRLTFQIGILISRLDMNCIVIAHEKSKYLENKEVGKIYDVNEKMAYSLGSVWNMRLQGGSRKLFVEKSRYPQLKTGELLDFENGYEVLKQRFGEVIFKKEAKVEELATAEDVNEFNRLAQLLNVPDTTVNKYLQSVQAQTVNDISRENIQAKIEEMKVKINNFKAKPAGVSNEDAA